MIFGAIYGRNTNFGPKNHTENENEIQLVSIFNVQDSMQSWLSKLSPIDVAIEIVVIARDSVT